ncbi:scavenger receptor cysteine-rich domain-containing protein [Toxoplasma gondii GT1]|uniref:Scavenger receptor cysteine-rich domain-containing protein n=2 Tax=Toxoplasma gondii TaxID=5811 RepID=S7W690_TOXGG|nr:scavenger receptor cysteine-rich domain-containing protein [Toxoplasma gondii GT1]RQX71561.1 scavenger receptor cysteine-rich domain-containing protein [Toxoplasma gondii CAST]
MGYRVVASLVGGLFLANSIGSVSATEWCRAAPEDGRPEYGVCLAAGEGSARYIIEIVPVVGPGIDLQSNVKLTVAGSDGSETKPIPIASEAFGTEKRVTVDRIDVGDPESVGVFITGNSAWKCKRITVWKDFRYWLFDCTGVLDPEHRDAIFTMSGNKMYQAIMQTGNDEHAGTSGGIELTLIGSERQSSPKLLVQDVRPGAERRIRFRAADVGDVTALVLRNTADTDPWYCEFVRIKTDDGRVFAFNVKRWIGTPYESAIRVSLKPSGDTDTPAQDVECHTRALELYSRIPENIGIFKVRCPMNCQASTFASVDGSSIHPMASSICAAAIHDGVLSPSGGEVVVSVVGELPEYTGSTLYPTGTVSTSFRSSPDIPSASFFVYRTDSIDEVDKDVRVVDAYGKLSSTGRLEIRRNGVWGSVCKQGDFTVFTIDSARKACHELGYLHGMYLEDGCDSVEGQYVCAGAKYPVSVAGVMCMGPEKSLADCTFEEPPARCADHSMDVAVRCTNTPPAEPPLGSLRIVDESGAPATNGVGRLQFYNEGWGSVCSDGWTRESEKVACLQMGYTGIKHGGYSDDGCDDVNGVNLCGPDTEKISAFGVACGGEETSLRHCPHEISSDIYCVHEEDIIVGCRGDGDPSGMGLFRTEDIPALSKRSLPPKIELNCGDRPLSQKQMGGQAGAMFVATCPEGCSEEPGSLKGTYIYTDDSPICKAAIHVGVVGPLGGNIVVVLGEGQDSFMESERNGVKSESFGRYDRTFMVSIPINSVKARTAKKYVDGATYAGRSAIPGGGKFPAFRESDTVTLVDVLPERFRWFAPEDFTGFRGRPEDYVDTEKLPGAKALTGFSDFTFALQMAVTGGKRKWRSILTQSGCEGFTFAIDDKDELVFEQNCHPKFISTGIKPAIGEPLHIAVSYYSPEKVVNIYVNGRQVVSEKTDFDFNLKSKLIIGRAADSESEYFIGHITALKVFSYALSPEQVRHVAAEAGSGLGAGGPVPRGERRTDDGRVCLSPCSSEEPLLNEIPKSSLPTNPAIQLTCEDTLRREEFNGITEQRFLVSCPSDCTSKVAQVYGSKVYSEASSLCKAALHSGALATQGGEVIIVTHSGLKSYSGSTGKNGVSSVGEDEPQLRSFSVLKAPNFRKLTCRDDGAFALKMNPGDKELVICPPGCLAASEGTVYGTKVYSPISSVCRAAIHSGHLTNEGGEVELQATGQHEEFKGSDKNGIQSVNSGWYLRAITFVRGAPVKPQQEELR